ncbi:K(+) efflux antiporter 5 [Camellia lanceoleosa]|uniref:K(+) efflux antiporter 5 n=1 Tax=Camellia lanceoleosa TaxID=1840588 RepID=A0ACC0G9Y1_9ERIC|nr:K(+) efflux antiporter 5 [Camellia lanceoleosa]
MESSLIYTDDNVAIFMAFQTPQLEVLGLTTIFGNVTTEDATRNALILSEIAGYPDVPVAEGSPEPLKSSKGLILCKQGEKSGHHWRIFLCIGKCQSCDQANVEPIRNFFAALFLANIGMLIHVHFLWNHIDILLAAVILVIVIKTLVVASVVKGFRYNNKTSLLVGMSLAQIGEFAFVFLSRASNVHLVEGKLYLLLLGTTALSLLVPGGSPDEQESLVFATLAGDLILIHLSKKIAGKIAGIDPLEQITKRCICIVETTETDVDGCALCRGHGFSKSVFGPQTVILCD